MNPHRLPEQETAAGQHLLKLQLLLGFPFPRDPETKAIRSALEIAKMPIQVRGAHCVATIIPGDDLIEVQSVETEPDHRHRGHATALLRRICYAGDLTFTDIRIGPIPHDATSPNRDQIIEWLERLGFEHSKDFMTRPHNRG